MNFITALLGICAFASSQAQQFRQQSPCDSGLPVADGVCSTGGEIPGVAGVDYPIFASVPATNFDCAQLGVPGYYADPESGCQAFYICERQGKGTGFLCPNGTLFNQEVLVCDWWNHVDCNKAVAQYEINLQIQAEMEAANERLGVNQRERDRLANIDNRFLPAGINNQDNRLNPFNQYNSRFPNNFQNSRFPAYNQYNQRFPQQPVPPSGFFNTNRPFQSATPSGRFPLINNQQPQFPFNQRFPLGTNQPGQQFPSSPAISSPSPIASPQIDNLNQNAPSGPSGPLNQAQQQQVTTPSPFGVTTYRPFNQRYPFNQNIGSSPSAPFNGPINSFAQQPIPSTPYNPQQYKPFNQQFPLNQNAPISGPDSIVRPENPAFPQQYPNGYQTPTSTVRPENPAFPQQYPNGYQTPTSTVRPNGSVYDKGYPISSTQGYPSSSRGPSTSPQYDEIPSGEDGISSPGQIAPSGYSYNRPKTPFIKPTREYLPPF